MLTRNDIIEAARANGFADVGFTTADTFDDHAAYLAGHQAEYGWAETIGLNLLGGTDPKTFLPEAKTVIVLLEFYFRQAFPAVLEHHFGRCYLDDDRVTKDGLALRLKAFRSLLREHGIQSKVPFNLPHRSAAVRAGMGTLGRNGLFYAGRVGRRSSWNLPIAVIIDREFTPDAPTAGMDCPTWCRNTCIAACPTRALKGDGTLDPRRCISFLSYFGSDLTPVELREPMGLYVYGCDRCQDVCPRNAAWLAAALPMNPKVAAKADDFDLSKLLHMDKTYFESRIWPHMFYMPAADIWRWKMNVARVMGNTLDPVYVDDLMRAYRENSDSRVQAMCAWALGKIGGPRSRDALSGFRATADARVAPEIESALGMTVQP
jgi:epoxyqueuosine reductase